MLKNKLLQQAQEHIEQGVEDKDVYQRLVKAGMKTIYNQKIFGNLSQELRKSKTPVDDVARGMVFVLKVLSHRARGTIPTPPLLAAGMTLVLDALDFLEQAGMLKVDARALDRATQEYVEALLPAVGLSHDKLNAVMAEIKQVMADPEKMAQYQRSLGSKQ